MSTLAAPFVALAVATHPDNLEYLVLVQVLEASARDHILVVLLRIQEASLLQPLAVERVRVLKDVAHIFYADVLGEDVLALPLDGRNAEAVSEGQ